jgi:hypothetical protein
LIKRLRSGSSGNDQAAQKAVGHHPARAARAVLRVGELAMVGSVVGIRDQLI